LSYAGDAFERVRLPAMGKTGALGPSLPSERSGLTLRRAERAGNPTHRAPPSKSRAKKDLLF